MSGQGNAQSWTEHEVVRSLPSTYETAKLTVDSSSTSSASSRLAMCNSTTTQIAPVPAGRNVNGCRQKINKTKLALKPEIDALKAGSPIAAAVTTPAGGTPTKKAATPRKRKPQTDNEGNTGEVTPKKGRGRPKKNKEPTPEAEEDQEDLGIKPEFGEDEVDDILKEAELI
ncbi:hypothetical protein IG631_09746 [Alternaria alternata]|nr:hypothetical protein IG631_09746 [Alternaria alternata]